MWDRGTTSSDSFIEYLLLKIIGIAYRVFDSDLCNTLYIFFEGSTAIEWPKPVASPSAEKAISDLISRVLDGAPAAGLFQVSINADLAVNGKDVFELSNGSASGSILISASTGVAAAWGFNYYLKYVADSSCKRPYGI